MRDTIIIHCSATRAGQDFTAADIDRWHRARGFRSIGYHFVIRLDGTIEPGRDVSLDGAHCTGWNRRSIGICYVGGLDKEGRPADTRTEAQREALIRLVEDLRLPTATVTALSRPTSLSRCAPASTYATSSDKPHNVSLFKT